jgi:hypothetical protein
MLKFSFLANDKSILSFVLSLIKNNFFENIEIRSIGLYIVKKIVITNFLLVLIDKGNTVEMINSSVVT